jgi:tRNA A37 threonylcarbamoyladenosine dehydratase
MENNQFERTIGLLGEKHYSRLKEYKICLVGLGGVGGTTFEGLIRSGFENILIIDCDFVSETNLNRQLLFTKSDVGLSKVEIAKKRAESINNAAKIHYIHENVNKIDFKLIEEFRPDIIIDAIDDVEGKIKLAKFASTHNISFIMSLGMANRLDPTMVRISTLDKTTHDPLAKKMRYEIRKQNLDTKGIKVVHSLETPIKDGNKLHSMMMVPSAAGLAILKEVITFLSKE